MTNRRWLLLGLLLFVSGCEPSGVPDPSAYEWVDRDLRIRRVTIDGHPCIVSREAGSYAGTGGITCDWTRP